MAKSKLEAAVQLTDDWSRAVIALTRDIDARDSDWETKMPTKVYAAVKNLWIERRKFLEYLAIELAGSRKRR